VERTSPLGTSRVFVDRTLVLALVTAALTGWAGAAQRPVPPELVGVWQGGAHADRHWTYAVSADGGYRAWPATDPAAVNTGTVVVDGSTITFSNGGAPVSEEWSTSGGRLVLDGEAYTRR
jgi:hypothetical protein